MVGEGLVEFVFVTFVEQLRHQHYKTFPGILLQSTYVCKVLFGVYFVIVNKMSATRDVFFEIATFACIWF